MRAVVNVTQDGQTVPKASTIGLEQPTSAAIGNKSLLGAMLIDTYGFPFLFGQHSPTAKAT